MKQVFKFELTNSELSEAVYQYVTRRNALALKDLNGKNVTYTLGIHTCDGDICKVTMSISEKEPN